MCAKKVKIPDEVDFAILTIIPEERDAVMEVIGTKTRIRRERRDYYYGEVSSSIAGQKHSIVMGRSRDRGNNSAGLAAEEMLREFKPHNFLVVGIGGGVEGRDEIAPGDVVAHNNLEYYELEKETTGKRQQRPMYLEPPSPSLARSVEHACVAGEWSARIVANRPADKHKLPKVVQGLILSGDKLLGDPTSELLARLLKQYDKAVGVEMESGGVARALYENRSFHHVEFMIVRGISDYCNVSGNQETRDAWKIYAAEAAAALALGIIQDTEPTRHFPTYYEEYKKTLVSSLSNDLTAVGNDFNLTFSLGADHELASKTLPEKASEKKRLILRGYAGGGKSLLVRKCAIQLVQDNVLPIIFDLKSWKERHSNELNKLVNDAADLDARLDVLLKVSITDINREILDSFPAELPRLLIVDGINEVFGQETGKQIIDLLDEYVQKTAHLRTSVVVTDRLSQHGSADRRWSSADLNLLDTSEVERAIKDRFSEEAFKELSDNDLKLLSIPYYLNIALSSKSTSPQLGSAAKAIESYFLNQVRLDETELMKLSKTVFKRLLKEKSSSFQTSQLSKAVGNRIWNRLQGSGAIKLIDEFTQFEHQLHQDYLLSKSVASDLNYWNAASFDAVSFDSKSPESLEMVLEQLPDSQRGDEFLTSLYDWNWGITVQCLANAAQSEHKNYSLEMETVILAVVAEKLLDRIERTRQRAKDHLSLFPVSSLNRLVRDKDLDDINLQDIFALVDKVESKEGNFLEWRALFTRQPDQLITETEIAFIASANPVLGWTAANVIRRFSLTENDLRYLRGIYVASIGLESRRWRVVHAIGKSGTKENVALLINALETETKWVRYGAVRSLVELAALTESEALRQEVFERLTNLIASLESDILREASNALFYSDPPFTWTSLGIPLLEAIRDKQNTESERQRAEHVLERFKSFSKKECVE